MLASTRKALSAEGDFELMQVAHDDAAVRAATAEAGHNLVQAFLALKPPIVVAGDGECPSGRRRRECCGLDAICLSMSPRRRWCGPARSLVALPRCLRAASREGRAPSFTGH